MKMTQADLEIWFDYNSYGKLQVLSSIEWNFLFAIITLLVHFQISLAQFGCPRIYLDYEAVSDFWCPRLA